MWLVLLLVVAVVVLFWLWRLLLRLHHTQLFVDINEAYYVVLARHCKHVLRQEDVWRDALHSPLQFALVSSLMVMHFYGQRTVPHYEPLFEPLLQSDEFHLYELRPALWMLVFKGMSSNFEYYEVLADDGLQQQPVPGDRGQVMRVFRRWWQHCADWMAGPLGQRLREHLQQEGARLWVVGFSRGGVYAEYSAYMLREWRDRVAVCTLGKPMSGDRVWALTLDSLYGGGKGVWGGNVRCAVIGDPIVNLPWANWADKTQGWYPTQATTAVLLQHRETDYLWKYHALKTYYEALQQELRTDHEALLQELKEEGRKKCGAATNNRLEECRATANDAARDASTADEAVRAPA